MTPKEKVDRAYKAVPVRDVNAHFRSYYLRGYNDAEKDLKLTKEDIEEIVHIYFVTKALISEDDPRFYDNIFDEFERRKRLKEIAPDSE